MSGLQQPLVESGADGQSLVESGGYGQLMRRASSARRSSLSRVASSARAPPQYATVFPPLFVVPGLRLCAILVLLGGALALCLTVWRDWLEAHGLPAETLLEYTSIPVVSTVFTYFHIWAALYMTFYPLKYIGCLQIPDTNAGCGWQGIVPSKAKKMACTAVKLMTEKVVSPQEMFARIDPKKLASELDPVLHVTLMQIINDVAEEEEPKLWHMLPQVVKDELIVKAREDAPHAIESLMTDVKENIDTVFDLEEMIVNAFTRDPGLLDHMFISCGYDELVFIRDCGAWMGAIFGIVQVGLWVFYSAGWMLPAFGFVVGIISNWLALKIIFSPVDPVPLFGGRVVIQGLFLKRQVAVSDEYAQIVAHNVLASRNLIPAILKGRCADKLFDVIHKHVCAACDEYAGISKNVIRMFAGSKKMDTCKHKIGDHLIHSLPITMSFVEKYLDQTMDLENLLAERMGALPSRDFEQLLHPVFEEDEWKLILMGGVLGIVIGLMQWHFLGA